MKKILRTVATLLIGLSTLIGGSGALAAANDPIAPAKGNLTIHKYILTDTPAGPSGTGQANDVNDVPKDAILVEGVEFTVYPIGAAVIEDDSEDAPTIIPGGTGWSYSLNTAKTQVTATNGSESYVYSLGTGIAIKTGDDGTATWEELTKGYYLVVESNNSEAVEVGSDPAKKVTIDVPMVPTVVAVPMTDPEGTGWIKDVHLFPKNEGIEAEKEVEQEDGVSIGDTLNFAISSTIPEAIKDYKIYNIVDELTDSLDLVSNSVKVYVTKEKGLIDHTESGSFAEVPSSGGYYTVAGLGAGVNGFRVSFTKDGFAWLKENGLDKGFKYVTVEFQATINHLAVVTEDGNIVTNKGTLEYGDKDSNESEPNEKETEETETPVGEIEIIKVDKDGDSIGGNSKSNLSAKFKISVSENAAKAKAFIKVKYDEDDAIVSIAYPYADEDGFSYTADGNLVTELDDYVDYEVETDANGEARFVGLQVTKDGEKDYWLVETKAPEGYNLLSDPVKVTIIKGDSETPYVLETKVVNSNEFTLPQTGGIGSIILTVSGVALLGFAILMMLNKKKKA